MKNKEFKGTPAPWTITKSAEGLHAVWLDRKNEMPVYVARTCFKPQSEANAKLIAAAPDLLYALENLLYSLNSYDENDQDAINQAKQAIYKALN